MKFKYGDKQDQKLVNLISHEFIRVESAFWGYISALEKYDNIIKSPSLKQNEINIINIYGYNYYTDFISHLYEFYKACFMRDKQDTAKIDNDEIDKLLYREANKYKKMMLSLIDSGKREEFGLHNRKYYKEKIPTDLSNQMRTVRNKTFHTDIKRISNLNLANFHKKYHKFVLYLFFMEKEWWSIENIKNSGINLDNITNFIPEILSNSS